MSRSYSVATVAFAVGAETKWVDNLLARHDVPGVVRGGRGVELAVSGSGLLVVAALHRLVVALGAPIAVALPLAARLAAGPHGEVAVDGVLALRLDRRALEGELAARLVDAADAIAPRRRGRPPRRRARAG